MITRIQRALAALILLGAPAAVRAVDGGGGSAPAFTWGGTVSNDTHNGANWIGGAAPDSASPADLTFGSSAPFRDLLLTSSTTVNSLRFDSRFSYYLSSASGATLLLGAGGITLESDGDSSTFVDFTYGSLLALGANQTWTIDSGRLSVYSDITSAVGGTSLTKAGSGDLVLGGASTFTGGVTVSAGTLYLASSSHSTLGAVDSGPVGTGRLTLADGVTLAPILNPVSLANDLTLGNNVTFGTADNTLSFELAGTVTPTNPSTTVELLGYTPVVFSGALADGAASTSFRFTSSSLFGAAALSGTNSYTGGTSVDGAAVVFFTPGSVPTAGNIAVLNGGHLGSGYDGGPTELLRHVAAPGNFNGALGLETDPSASTPTYFFDAFNFAAFNSSTFSGLGTLSSAIFAGTVTPVGGGNYKFGGMGGGTLYVAAALPAAGTAGVSVDSYAYSWLTTILRGNNTYTGDLLVASASVILDSANALPAGTGQRATLSGLTPYLGYTEEFKNGGTSGVTFADFLARVSFDSGVVDPVIGFDSHDLIDEAAGGTPRFSGPTIRTVADDIDLGSIASGVYLGSATQAILTGRIHDGDLSVAGVGNGWLTIAAPLTSANAIGRVTVGSSNGPTNQNTSAGVVEFSSGASDYRGDTSLYNGFLVVSASSTVDSDNRLRLGPLGTGKLQILGDSALVAGATSVTLHNWINLGASRRLQIGVPTTLDTTDAAFPLQDLRGNDLTLAGPITAGDGAGLDVYGTGTLALANENYFADLKLYGGTLRLDHDQAAQSAKLTLENGSDLFFTTQAPRVASLSGGYGKSDNVSVVSLASGSELTLGSVSGQYFSGSIEGLGAKLLLSSYTGSISLSGVSTYTGGTTIESGELIAAHDSALGTGAVSIVGGRLSVDPGVTLPNAITFAGNDGFGGHLSGTGTLSGSVTIANDGILSPNWEGSIGQLSFTHGLTFGPGGHYHFDPGDANHLVTPGTDYDTVAITGTLNTAATLAAPFAFDLPDPPENFDRTQRYSWTVATTTGGITTSGTAGFDAGRFTTDTASDDGGLIVTTGNEGKNLLLSYLPSTVWSGASPDHSFTNPANWQGGTVPASDGSAWIRFDAASRHDPNTIILPSTFNAAKFAFGNTDDDGAMFFVTGVGPTTLTLGHGIYSSAQDHDGGGVHVTFDANVNLILANSQLIDFGGEYSSIDIQGNISESGTGRAFGIAGYRYNGDTLRLAGNNTFTGGVFVGENSRVVVGSDTALGTGTLTLGDHATIAADGARILPNPVVFGGGVAFLESWDESSADRLTFNGLFTLNGSITLTSYLATDVRIAHGIVESTAYASSFAYSNRSGGKLILTGGASYTGGTHVAYGTLIFGDAASVPATGSISAGSISADGPAYVGLADPAGLATLLDRLAPNDFYGTLGFDSLGSGSNTFTNLNLSGLLHLKSIGTQTFATLSGTLTPAGPTYAFGGGAGTLTVTSVLEDDASGHTTGGAHAFSVPSESAHASSGTTGGTGARSLTLGDGMKLNLYGNNTYTGGTTVDSGHLYAGSATAFGTGPVTVYDGRLEVPSGIAIANGVTLVGNFPYDPNQLIGPRLTGSGTLSGTVDFQSGSVLSPEGSGVGKLTFSGPLTWGAGAAYEIDFGPGTGNLTAGIDYDTIVSTHPTFTLAATAASPFNLTFDTPSGFDSTQAYAWKIASTSAGIANFDTGHFALDNPATTYHEGFTLGFVGTDLYLRHTPPTLWTGNADGTHYATVGNWAGHTSAGLPPTDGTARLYFGNVNPGRYHVELPGTADVSRFEFVTTGANLFYQFSGPSTITLRDGIQSYSYYSSVTFGADVSLLLANSQTFGGFAAYQFLGPIGEVGSNRTLTFGYGTSAVLSGSNTYSGGTHASIGAQLVFTSDASVPAAGSISSDPGSYVGLPSPSALARVDAPNFYGRLGLESFGASTNTYANLDLTHYANDGRIGTSTSALVSGTLTLPTGQTVYNLGGGGGKLTVSANLADNGSSPRHFFHNGDGTVILTGNNTFSGMFYMGQGGATLLAGPNALPSSLAAFSLSAGSYLGYTEAYSPASPTDFFARPTVDSTSMLGIDSADAKAPRTILGSIDLSNHGARTGSFFLGTATKVILSSGTITPPTSDKTLYFGATFDGYLVVNNTLAAGTVNSLVVGSADWTGTVELGGNNTFNGGTTVNGGLLIVAHNSALGAPSSAVTVGQGGRLSIANGVTLSNIVSFAGGGAKAVLSGNGTYGTPITLGDGGGMAPGNSIGHLNFAAGLTWSGGGGYEVEVQDVSTAAGVGYDTASVTGALAFTASIGSPFTIYLKSLTGAGAAGNVANFVDSAAYTWFIADATSLTGFGNLNSSTLSIDTSGFTNAFTGSFGLTTSGNSVLLNYTPAAVPEPSTWALLLTGAAALALLSRRKRTP